MQNKLNDKAVEKLIKGEERRQAEGLELIPSENYVLQNFTQEELEGIKTVLKKEAIEYYLKEGIEKSQNFYN